MPETRSSVQLNTAQITIILVCLLGIVIILYQIFGPDQGGGALEAPVAERSSHRALLTTKPFVPFTLRASWNIHARPRVCSTIIHCIRHN